MTNLCALLLACAAFQAPSAPPAATQPEWVGIDRVIAIVNQDIITYKQMVRELKHEIDTRQINNLSERQAAESRVLRRRVKALLAKQAGHDMGADEAMVERRVQESMERIIAGNNGVVGMSKIMQSKDVNAQDVKKGLREDLYSRTFIEWVTGEGAGLAERPNRDRYVRPGNMKFRYERALRNPELLRQIGGSTELVTLQMMAIDSDKQGGRDKTMTLASELELSIQTGAADMDDLVQRYSVNKANNGVEPAFEIARLRRLEPGLAKFVDDRPADPSLWARYVSPPEIVQQTDTRILVRLVRIREITPGEIPALDTNQTQEQIAKQAQESLDEYRLERAYAKLYEAAYIWPQDQAAPKER